MFKKLTIESIDRVQLPPMDESSLEEALFEAPEASTHEDHKLLEANKHTLEVAKQKIRKLEIENDDLAMLGPHRRTYSWWILAFVLAFVVITFVILVLSSLQIEHVSKTDVAQFYTLLSLDNKVLMTLLATNTVQVVGLLYVVAKWLFPTKLEEKPSPTDNDV